MTRLEQFLDAKLILPLKLYPISPLFELLRG